MRLIVLQSDAMVDDVICGQEAIYVGNKDTCRVHLSDARIAPQHLVIYPESDGTWSIEPLEIGYAACVNGTQLLGKSTLHTGDEILLEPYLLRAFPDFEEPAADRGHVMTTKESLERFIATQLPSGTIVKRPDEPVSIGRAALVRSGKAAVALSGCTLPTEFMDVALTTFLSAFAAHRVWIGVRRVNYGPMEYVEGRTIHGVSADLPSVAEPLQTRVLDRSAYLLVPRLNAEERLSILAGPLLGPEGPLGMIYIDTGDGGRRFETSDLDEFVHLTSVFAAQLHAIFHNIARNRAALIEGSVSVAHEIQARLTPRKLPQWEMLQFGAFRETGRLRAGDIYDVVKLVNNIAALFVAHTALEIHWPSMLLTQAHAAFRSACMHQDNPQVFLRGLNWLLYDPSEERSLDCFMCAIDPASGALHYSVAGTIGAYIINCRGSERRLGGDPATPPLGAGKQAECPVHTEVLAPGESLVVFTNGVTTARNRQQKVFGEARFLDILCDGFGQQASVMLKDMLSDLRNFTDGGMQPDDITVLLAHRVQ